jgi:hypothetical protein
MSYQLVEFWSPECWRQKTAKAAGSPKKRTSKTGRSCNLSRYREGLQDLLLYGLI